MNGYEYPNYLQKVNTGVGTTQALPIKCQELIFSDTPVYTWMNGQPGIDNEESIYSLNFNTIHATLQPYSGNSTICVDGEGTTCDKDYNAVTTNQFTSDSSSQSEN